MCVTTVSDIFYVVPLRVLQNKQKESPDILGLFAFYTHLDKWKTREYI